MEKIVKRGFGVRGNFEGQAQFTARGSSVYREKHICIATRPVIELLGFIFSATVE
jgi:hypothetical protein